MSHPCDKQGQKNSIIYSEKYGYVYDPIIRGLEAAPLIWGYIHFALSLRGGRRHVQWKNVGLHR